VSAPPEFPEKADVQRLVAYGYDFERSRHFILEVKTPQKARAFLAGLVELGLITDASADNEDVIARKNRGCCPTHIGFTFRGLQELRLSPALLLAFREKAQAYTEGAALRAARRLADSGASAAPWWDASFQHGRAHLLLSFYADTENELDRFAEVLRQIPGADDLDGWDAALDGCHLSPDKAQRRVHFGFRDGISNPRIAGFHSPEAVPESKAPGLHAPGEFLLGYENDEGFNPWLLLNPEPRPNPWLLPTAHFDPGFFRNGSFAAFRKIEQHEAEFNAFVSAHATQLGVSEAYVRAKLAGRWDDGSVVRPDEESAPLPAPANDGDPPPEAPLNDFDFSDDAKGRGCPFGAHIRRMNPRGDLIVPFRRRPLIRRGMPYGRRYQDAPADKRGLLGLFFCASLEDQFEHLLAQWGYANPMGPDNWGDAKDPLIGNHQDARAVFDIPVAGEQTRQIDGFKPFVTTRGTLYAFYPGLSALRDIARMDALRR